MTSLVGKVALVTGGRSGIGAAISNALAAAGAQVFTAQRGADAKFDHFITDFLDPEAPQELMHQVIKKTGRLDILINNAGLMREANVLECSREEWQGTLQVNLTAPFLLTKAAMPHLIETKGAIVNVGSIEGLGSKPRHPAYCASKAGLHGLTRAVAVDHGPDGVRCNAVAPGWIDTDLNNVFVENLDDPERFRKQIAGIHPLRRTGQPKDVGALVVWLASDAAAFVTGQVWTVDGGRTSQLSLPKSSVNRAD